jgi:hypothetical protein
MAVLVNRLTGEAFEPDARVMRQRRLWKRTRGWAQAIAAMRLKRKRTRMIMVTLTLRPGAAWQANMIREFMLTVRKILKNRLLGYAWVAEMQRRGAVHYHVLLVVPSDARLPKPDRAGLWAHGSTRIETARKAWYIVKYTQKFEEGVIFPRGLRLFAVFIARDAVSVAERWEFRLSTLPRWMIDLMREDYRLWSWERVRGGYALAPPGEEENKETIKTDWEYFHNLNLCDIQGLW